MATTKQIEILEWTGTPDAITEAVTEWDPNACSASDYGTPRARALYDALGVERGDEEYALAAHHDGRWALIGLTTQGHRWARETGEVRS